MLAAKALSNPSANQLTGALGTAGITATDRTDRLECSTPNPHLLRVLLSSSASSLLQQLSGRVLEETGDTDIVAASLSLELLQGLGREPPRIDC
jgi:hypothetical protein